MAIKAISTYTDKQLVNLTTDELAAAIREEAILQGVQPPTEVFALPPLNIAFDTNLAATKALPNVVELQMSRDGNLTALRPDGTVQSRWIDPIDPVAFKAIQDAGLERFAKAQANDGLSKKMIAKRDSYLAAAGGDVATATKFWNIENPTTPWPA